MPEHSIAKIAYYKKYLSTYLNIIERANYIKKIFLYDFLQGRAKTLRARNAVQLQH
jgi:hypothetical protein